MKGITCSEEEKEEKKMKTLDLGGHFFFGVLMFHLGFSKFHCYTYIYYMS